MHTDTGFTWLSFLHYAFSNESSNRLPERMQTYIGCICLSFFLVYSHWLHWLDFSPVCVFRCVPKLPAWEEAKLQWLRLLGFSPLCVFKCLLKSPGQEEAYSHWLHLFDFSPLCIFRCVLKSPDQEDLTIDWLHSFGFFPVRVFKCLHNTHFVQKWIGRIKRELSSPSFWSRSTSYQFSCGPQKVS